MTDDDRDRDLLPPAVAQWFVEQRAFWRIARAEGEVPPDPAEWHPRPDKA